MSSTFYTLGELCNITTGKLDANKMVENGKYPFFTCDPTPYKIDTFAFDCECILIGGNNASGNFPIHYFKGKFNAYQRTYVITIKDANKINIKYLYYHLMITLKILKNKSRGSLTKFLTLGILQNIKIPKLTFEEYNNLGDKLGFLDSSVEHNKKNIDLLEQLCELEFYKWFKEFKFPGFENTTFVEENPDFKIPEKWKIGSLSDICTLIMGQSPPSESYNTENDGLPFYQGVLDFGIKYPSVSKWCSKPTRVSLPKDVLLSVRAPVGQLNIAVEECCIGRGVAALRIAGTNNYYLFYELKDRLVHLLNRGNGTIFNSIKKSDIQQLSFTIPPIETIMTFEKYIEPMQNEIMQLNKQIEYITQARDLIISKYII